MGNDIEYTREEKLMLVLEHHRASREFLRHEDQRKSHLFTIFFVVQSVLFGSFGVILSNQKGVAFGLAVFAVIFCILWFLVMKRMLIYVELRYFELLLIEANLGIISVITNEVELRDTGKVQFMEQQYAMPRYLRWFSVSRTLENLLPILIGITWIVTVLTAF